MTTPLYGAFRIEPWGNDYIQLLFDKLRVNPKGRYPDGLPRVILEEALKAALEALGLIDLEDADLLYNSQEEIDEAIRGENL